MYRIGEGEIGALSCVCGCHCECSCPLPWQDMAGARSGNLDDNRISAGQTAFDQWQ